MYRSGIYLYAAPAHVQYLDELMASNEVPREQFIQQLVDRFRMTDYLAECVVKEYSRKNNPMEQA